MKVEKILKSFFIFGGIYFIFDALLHLLGIKLFSVTNIWPQSALSYSKLMNQIYASFVILAAVISFVIQKDLKKYQTLILVSGIWAFFHGIILFSLVSWGNYQEVFKELPSLQVWLPFYGPYLILNSVLLFIFSGLVIIWFRRKV